MAAGGQGSQDGVPRDGLGGGAGGHEVSEEGGDGLGCAPADLAEGGDWEGRRRAEERALEALDRGGGRGARRLGGLGVDQGLPEASAPVSGTKNGARHR